MTRALLQQALDALENSYFSDEHRNYELQAKAIAALREALNAPEQELDNDDVLWLWKNGNHFLAFRHLYPCYSPGGDPMTLGEPFGKAFFRHSFDRVAAPPAAPAEDHATPSGGQEAGPQEDRIEAAYWRFDARHKGYSQWKTAPMSERDAFKAEMRNALESEKVRAEMRLVARGWRRPDAPAAPAPAAPVPDGWVMVPREPTPVPLVEGGYAELATRMRGRADFIRDQGGIKSAELMEQGADAITFLAAPPVAPAHVPLTDSELAKIAVEDEFLLYCDQDSFNEIARAIELAHGITGASNG